MLQFFALIVISLLFYTTQQSPVLQFFALIVSYLFYLIQLEANASIPIISSRIVPKPHGLDVGLLRQPRQRASLFGRRLLLEPRDSPILQTITMG